MLGDNIGPILKKNTKSMNFSMPKMTMIKNLFELSLDIQIFPIMNQSNPRTHFIRSHNSWLVHSAS